MTAAPDLTCDLLVVGSGASGLSAAVTAAWLGLDVIVAEKDAQIGGTSAWSGGWMWVPRNPLAVEAGIIEDIDAPRCYLKAELGARYQADLVEMFLEQAPRMVAFSVSTHASLSSTVMPSRIFTILPKPPATAGARSVPRLSMGGNSARASLT